MTVKDYMKKFLRVDYNMLVKEVATLMGKQETGSALVTKEEEPIGIVTERDFLKKVVAKGLNAREVKVKEVMSSPIITIKLNESTEDASLLMDKKNIRRLAVIDEKGKVVGKITAHGISRGLRLQKLKKAFADKPRNYYAPNIG